MSIILDTSCKDWKQRIVDQRPLISFDPPFPDMADIAENIFKELIVVDVMDSPKMGEITRQWVYDFVRAIFGCYDIETNKRLIQEFFLLISKKNTKSTLAAGIMLTALVLNERASAELVILAPTKEVADNSFIPLRDFIKADEELSEKFSISEHTRTITDIANNSTIKVIAADSNAAAGKKATIVLIDEVWLFGQRAHSDSLFREAKGGLTSRTEGAVIYLSTMSDDVPAGVFKDLLEYARGVRDGEIIDPAFLPVLYEFPEEMIEEGKHLDPEYWYITNPNLGTSVSKDYLVREFGKVKNNPNSLPDFMAKHLNVEIGMNLRAGRWAGAEFWLDAPLKSVSLDYLIEMSDKIVIGGDGGGLDDLLGIAVLGRCKKDPSVWYAWFHALCHEVVLERRKSEEPKLRGFEKDGNLTIYKKVGDDIKKMCEIIKMVKESGKFAGMGLDPAMIGSIKDAMDEEGILEDDRVGVPQGWKLMEYMLIAERKLASYKIMHDGSDMMKWVVGNAKTIQSGSGLRITKQQSGTGKIDPLIAFFNACAMMVTQPDPKPKYVKPSIYIF